MTAGKVDGVIQICLVMFKWIGIMSIERGVQLQTCKQGKQPGNYIATQKKVDSEYPHTGCSP